MNKYNSGKIYKVVNTIDDNIYIGSTITRLCDRIGSHRKNAKNEEKQSIFYTHMRKVGIEHFKIILIKLFPCESKDELEAEEFNEMSKYDKSILLNDNTVFKKRSPNHVAKVIKKGEESANWKYGSIFERKFKSTDGYDMHCFCYSWYESDGKIKRSQFSIKKYGYEKAREMAEEKQKEVFPNMNSKV